MRPFAYTPYFILPCLCDGCISLVFFNEIHRLHKHIKGGGYTLYHVHTIYSNFLPIAFLTLFP